MTHNNECIFCSVMQNETQYALQTFSEDLYYILFSLAIKYPDSAFGYPT